MSTCIVTQISKEIKQSVRTVRGINYSIGQQDFCSGYIQSPSTPGPLLQRPIWHI